MTESPAPEADRNQLARAIGSLIWKDPARILDVVSQFRDSGAVIECGLRGGSMEPAIPRGSRLRIQIGRAAPFRVGDVIAFVQESGICVHRVAHLGRGPRSRDHIVTQGDACFNPDAPVGLRQVVGPVIEFRHGERWTTVANPSSAGRAQSLVGRSLLTLIAALTEVDVRLGRCAARFLRIRKEEPAAVEA